MHSKKKCLKQYKLCFFTLIFVFFHELTFAQFTIIEDFKGQISSDIILGDDAYLTSGKDDPVGSGWLRLTADEQSRKGYAYINRTFPSTLGILVDFEYKMWRTKDGRDNTNGGGDGFSVFLFDGTTTPAQFRLGGYGGSLGYARNKEGGNNLTGLRNGYLGIGFDAYGNFVNKNAPNKFSGSDVSIPNSISIRGKTTAADDATTNRFLKGISIAGNGVGTISQINANQNRSVAEQWQNHIDYNFTSGLSSGSYPKTRPADNIYYRRVQIEIKPAVGNTFEVIIRWKRENQTDFTELMRYITTDIPPATLKMGFAASTGWAVNYHEIRNVLVTTPGDLRVVKKANKEILRSVSGSNPSNQNEVTYTIEVSNETNSNLSNISFKDRITDGVGNLVSGGNSGAFKITNITTSGFNGTSLPNPTTANPLASNEIVGSLNMYANSVGRITVTGNLNSVPAASLLTNVVTIMPTDIQDQDLENNTSIVSIPVNSEDIDLSVLQNVDKSCLDATNGNIVSISPFNNGSTITYGGINTTATVNSTTKKYSRNRLEVAFQFPTGSKATLDKLPSGWEELAKGSDPYLKVYRTTSQFPSGDNWGNQKDNVELKTGYAAETFKFKVVSSGGGTIKTTVNYIREVGTITKTENSYVYNTADISTTSLDLDESNNTAINTLYTVPNTTPIVPSNMQKYCVGQPANVLTATATNSNYTLNWYSSLNGVKLNNAPTPSTAVIGSYKYYVSQSNGTCEGPVSEITVQIKDCRVLTNPILINQSRR